MTSNGWSSLLWFAAIVVAIPFVLVLLKRTPLGGGGASGPGSMRVVGALAVAPNQRVVTVEVGTGAERRWLVLGVGPQSISTLHTMLPGPDDANGSPSPAQGGPSFAQVAARLWSRPHNGSPDAR